MADVGGEAVLGQGGALPGHGQAVPGRPLGVLAQGPVHRGALVLGDDLSRGFISVGR